MWVSSNNFSKGSSILKMGKIIEGIKGNKLRGSGT